MSYPAAVNPPLDQVRKTRAPTNKVMGATSGSAVGTAIGTIIAWGIDYSHLLPADVHNAIVIVVAAIFTFVAGYYVPPSPGQTVMTDTNGKSVTATRV